MFLSTIPEIKSYTKFILWYWLWLWVIKVTLFFHINVQTDKLSADRFLAYFIKNLHLCFLYRIHNLIYLPCCFFIYWDWLVIDTHNLFIFTLKKYIHQNLKLENCNDHNIFFLYFSTKGHMGLSKKIKRAHFKLINPTYNGQF